MNPYWAPAKIIFEVDSSNLLGLFGGLNAGVFTVVAGPMAPSTLLAVASGCPPKVTCPLDREPVLMLPWRSGAGVPNDPSLIHRAADADAPRGGCSIVSTNLEPGGGGTDGPALMFALGMRARISPIVLAKAMSFASGLAPDGAEGLATGLWAGIDAVGIAGLVPGILFPLSRDCDLDLLAVRGTLAGSAGGPSSLIS